MKATKAVVQQRVERVYDMRLMGATFLDIRRYASSPEPPDEPWGVSDRQVQRYIEQADKLSRKFAEKRADRQFALHLLRLERLYALAFQAGDYRGALRALDVQARLLGLFPAQRIEHTGPEGGPIPVNATSGGPPMQGKGEELTNEQIAAFLAGLDEARKTLETAQQSTAAAT